MPKFSPEKVYSFPAKGLGYGRLVVHAKSLPEAQMKAGEIQDISGVRLRVNLGRFVRRQRA